MFQGIFCASVARGRHRDLVCKYVLDQQADTVLLFGMESAAFSQFALTSIARFWSAYMMRLLLGDPDAAAER
jgi:hypothetical protein